MITFLLKLSLCWGLFALLYQGLLRYETFFRANRIYLLISLVSGIVLALLPAEQIATSLSGAGEQELILPAFTLTMENVAQASSQWQNIDFLWLVYWTGFTAMALRMFWGLWQLASMIQHGQHSTLSDGSHIVRTAAVKTPFSFFHWIFIPAADIPADLNAEINTHPILAHERAHAQEGHSADVLLAEILCIVFWFHPLAHWYKRALRSVHEYLADATASRLSNKKQYGLLLIGQSQSGMPIAFANHFYQSPLKQRLVMLTKKTSSPIRALKFGLLVPFLMFFALIFRQAPANAQTATKAIDNEASKGAPASKSVDAAPEFPGGVKAIAGYLNQYLKYPKSAKDANAEGTVVVSFKVDQDGTISEVSDLSKDKKNHPDLVAEAIRVVSEMPKWKPAVKEGEIVAVKMTLPINFKMSPEDNKDLNDLDKKPEYPGGKEALFALIIENVKYPEEAKKANVSGMAAIGFVVGKDGSLSDFEALSAPHPALAKEAIRVLKMMSKWTPGMKDGKAVSAKMTIPVRFSLD